jgi:hypothetical protein
MPDTSTMNAENFELNTALFESTFKIEQPTDSNQSIVATTFVLGRPYPNDPNKGRFVLVTAKHVLEDMKGDDAVWHLRSRDGSDQWQRSPVTLKIRTNGTPHWVTHPTADVAVMYVSLTPGVITFVLPTPVIAVDQVFEQFEIHPGDELNCLGYPMGRESNAAGFPILRSGKIASYPLYPTKQHPTFLYDFEVFGGNSGGPVFMVESNRNFKGCTHIGKIQFVAGLVSEQHVCLNERLALSVVVSSPLILETINMLPSPDLVP